MRQAKVYFRGILAGELTEEDEQYSFIYEPFYLDDPLNIVVSLTLPLQKEAFTGKTMFSFFDGLIPEGWLLDITVETWKLNPRDRMGLLLACCRDGIGAVTIIPVEGE